MIEKIIILSLCAIGICCTTWDDMILSKPARYIEDYLPEWLIKPLYGCFVCATFWWGAAIALLIGWPVWYCLPAMGASAVISMIQND